MTIEKDFFRQVMGQFTTGVTVVTARSQDGLAGLTVNSFTSVSLEPPLVLICVDLYSTALPFIRASGNFAVNILTSEQENSFAMLRNYFIRTLRAFLSRKFPCCFHRLSDT